MCRMAKTIGMMEKHPEDCDCEAHPKNKDEQKIQGKDEQFGNADFA